MKKIFAAITETSLRFRWVTIGLSMLLLVLGAFAFTLFNRELIPDIDIPQTIILMQSPGTSADELIELLTIPIEDKVKEVENVASVQSTTGDGFSVIQAGNDFGLNQEKLRAQICAEMNAVWLASGLARPWESVDLAAECVSEGTTAPFSTTTDVSAAVINEAAEKWPYLFGDLSLPELFSLPAEAVAALPETFLTTLPETTQKELLDITTGEREPGDALALPQSWLGLSRTTDLTPAAVEAILAAAPSMAGHFRNDNGNGNGGLVESYVFAMSPEVIAALPAELTANMSECSRQQLDAVLGGETQPDPPALLPDAWRSEPPHIVTFSFADIPVAFISVSGDFTPAELQAMVEGEAIPRLVAVEGVADVPVSGGQILPSEAGAEEAHTETEQSEADTDNPGSTPLPASSPWKLIGAQFGDALGLSIENYEDLTPEITNLLVAMIDGMGLPINGQMLLVPLQNAEAIDALPSDTLAWMPAAYVNGLDDDLRAAADARVAAETRYTAAGEAAQAATENGQLPVYFRLFNAMGEQFGLPLALNTPADLTPEIVATLNALIPGGAGVELLRPLNQAAWGQVPVETLGWLPADFVASLDEDTRTAIETRAEDIGGVGMLAAAAYEAGDLPPFFALLAQQPLLGGTRLCGPEDLSPELVNGIASFMPETLNGLGPAALKRLMPETLAVLPAGLVDGLPEDLRAELEEKAESAGGLGAATNTAATDSDGLSMPIEWDSPQLPKTADALLASQDGAAGYLNFIFDYLPDDEAKNDIYGSLSPELVDYLVENEPDFLDTVTPEILSLFSQEVLDGLDPQYQEIAANAFIPDNTVTRTNGEPSLLLTAYKDAEANTVEVAHKLFDELDAIEADLEGINTVISFEQASFIEESIDGVAREGGLGAIFAIIVIFFFLHRSWRSTIVTAVSIPLSVMIAFAAMQWLSPAINGVIAPLAEESGGIWNFLLAFFPAAITMNIMTLSGMTVAIGRVVDDSIVVLENIYRHIHRGEDPAQAVLEGTRDVSIAIFASTVTTIAVFLPIGLMGGFVGEIFIPFGMAVSYALGASFIVAITVIPVLAAWFVRREHMPEEKESSIQRQYTSALQWVLRGWNRGLVLLIAFVLFAVSLGLLSQRPQAFIPPIGEPQVSAVISLPTGTSIIETNRLVLQMEQWVDDELKATGRIEDYLTVIGGVNDMEAFIGSSGVNQATAQINAAVSQGEDTDELAQVVRAKAEEIFGAGNVAISVATISETGFGGLSLVLSSDPETLRAIDADVINLLSSIEGVANLSSSLEAASAAGDTAILRVNQQSAVQYTGELETEDTLGVTALAKEEVITWLAAEGLSDEVAVSEGFQSEMQTDGFASLTSSMLLAILVVYLVMVLTFRSLVHPFTILFSLPLAVVGAALALWLTNNVLGLPAMVGLLMLVGIVVTNAIVFIDRVQSNRKERNMDGHEALVEGGRTRLRPILMTALAAIFALIPLAAQLMGPGGAIVSAALGTVVIGGLITSTFLTLLVVPVVYSLLDQLTARIGKGGSKQES